MLFRISYNKPFFLFLTHILSMRSLYHYYHPSQEGRIISRKNLNEYLETLHLVPTQFCDLPGFYLQTGFLISHPLSLHLSINNLALRNSRHTNSIFDIRNLCTFFLTFFASSLGNWDIICIPEIFNTTFHTSLLTTW